MRKYSLGLLCLAMVAACDSATTPADSGVNDTSTGGDTTVTDTGATETGTTDTGTTDTAVTDTGVTDTAVTDTTVADTGTVTDTGVADSRDSAIVIPDTGIPTGPTVVSCVDATIAREISMSFSGGFNPMTTSVAPGSIVRWTNTDSGFGHSVTSDTGAFSASLPGGGTVCIRFPAVGTFPYHCTPHPSLTGTINVQLL